ncbi:hypothetical protein CXG81DRAFT_18112 [Caulochytrium protostelioides]|uniref:Uncharacterized protein n=1 Tax=Caulochytrium protostelioides TaxID=1555241 RepID=A0A4P9XA21_9FUNG|nr:hypothetical protein CXG81DRAFT_18112 [Caulochytrium protostelioides]|eukprot:RKP02214.1 hypothetical protein CXG81DRAFT_18112 [Caulochytrium protostelioides]
MASPPTHVVVHTTATHIETTTARSKSVYDEVMDEVDFFVDTTSDMALLGPRGPAAAAIPALARHSRTAVSIVETEIAERANADAGVSVATRVAADVSSTSPVPSLHRGNVDVMTIPNPAFVMVPTASATPATSTGTPSPTPSTATTQTKTKKKRKKKKKQVAARCMATVTPVSPPPPAGRTIPVPSCIEDLSLDPHWVPLPSMRRIKGLTTDATLIDAVIDGDLNVVDSPKPLSRKARQRQNAKQRKKAAKQQQQQKQVSPEQPPAGRANRQDYTKEGYVIDTDEYEDITDDSADAVDAEIVKDYLENAEGMDSCLDAMVNLDLGEPPARRVVEIAGKAVDSDNVMDDSSEAYYNSDLSSDFDSDSSSESAEGVPITTRKNRTHHASRTRPGRSLAVQIDAEEAEFEHIYEMAERMMGRGKKGASLLESIPRPPLPALSQHVGSLGRADLDSELGRMSKADRKKLNKFARKQVLLEQRAARAERRLANERTESAKAQRQGKTSPTTKFVQAMPTTDVYDGVKQFLREQNESMYALAADASLPRGMLHLVHGRRQADHALLFPHGRFGCATEAVVAGDRRPRVDGDGDERPAADMGTARCRPMAAGIVPPTA